MNRKVSYWKLRSTEIQTGVRTLVMGVLNVTPDSFSDGGHYSDPDRAYARALELEEEGADIIDIGGESTRPGSQRISAEEEWRRLVQVLKKLRGQLRIPISVDTWRAETAERALDLGADIINDPSGLTFDPGIAKVAANGNAALVLTHMRGQPDTWAKLPPLPDPAGTIARELEATVNRARHAGVEPNRIVVDPGIGFGKRGDQNSVILAQLRRLAELDLPVLVGVSRKSFLAQQADIDTEFATAAAVTASILNGAHIVRVHDVKRMLSVVKVADEIARASEVEMVSEKPEKPRRLSAQQREHADKPRPTRPPIAAPPVTAVPAPAPAAEIASSESAPAAVPENPPAIEKAPSPRLERAPRERAPREQAPRQRDGFEPPTRRPADRKGSGPPRRFEDRKFDKPKPAFERDDRRKDSRGGEKPPFRGAKPRFERSERPQTGRSEGGKPAFPGGKFRGEKPRFEKPRADKPWSDKPGSRKPGFDRPRSDKPKFDRPRSDKPGFDRPRSDKPGFDRPRSDKPGFDRPRSDKPGFDRPRSDKPRFGRTERPAENRGDGRKPPFRGGKPPDGRSGPPPKRPFRKRP